MKGAASSGWVLTLTLFFLTSMVESLGMSHVFAFLPVYLSSLHVHRISIWVGVLSALTFVVGLPLVPMWGVWANRIGGKAVIVRSAYVEMAVFLLFGLAHQFEWIIIAMMLVGFQLGNTGIMLASIRRLVPDGRIGTAVSIFSVSSPVGGAMGPWVAGWLTHAHVIGLHGLYLWDAGLSFATGTMLVLGYREQREPQSPSNHSTSQRAESAWDAAWKSVRFTFSLRIAWFLFGVYSLLMMARQMVNPYIPLAILRLPISSSQVTLYIGSLMGLAALVGAVITILAGRLGDRLGFQRMLVMAFTMAIPATVLLGRVHSVGAFVVTLTCFSAAISLGGAMIFALFSTTIPASHRSTALNLVYLPMYLGGIVGPFIASLLSKAGTSGPFIGGSVVCFAGAAIVLRFTLKRNLAWQ